MRFVNGMNIKGGEMALSATKSPKHNTNYRTLDAGEIDRLHSALQPTGYRVLVSLEAFAGSTRDHEDYRRRWLDVLRKLASLRVDDEPPDILVEPHGGSSENFGAWAGRKLEPTREASGDELEYTQALLRVVTECEAAVRGEGSPEHPLVVRYGTGNEPTQSGRDWSVIMARIYTALRGVVPPSRVVASIGGWSAAQTFATTQWMYADSVPEAVLQVHSYADADRSGRSPVPASLQVLYDDLSTVAAPCAGPTMRREWIVGEIGVSPTDTRSAQVFLSGLLAMHAARPLCRGWYWWGYGASPWYDSVLASVTPANVMGLPRWLVNAFRARVEQSVPADRWQNTASALLELAVDMLAVR